MTGSHPELGSELRQLAQEILDRLDPAVRLAAAGLAASADNPGKCQQVWCPVCALAAVANGEQHPLLSVIAEHSVALLTVIRALLDDGSDGSGGGGDTGADGGGPSPDGGPDAPPPDDYPPPPGPGRYQHIPVTVEGPAD